MPAEPEQRRQRRHSDDVRPCQRVADADVPQRIDRRQIRGPEELADVETQRSRRDQNSLNQRVAQGQRRPGGIVEPQVGQRDTQRHHEERRQPQQVGGGHPALLPPGHDQQRHRQGHHYGFGQQPRHEQQQGEDVACPPRRLHEPDPGQHGGEIEQAREYVLAFDYPGHRFHVHRVDGEERGSDPGPGNSQTPQDAPHQHGVDQVQRHVDQV